VKHRTIFHDLLDSRTLPEKDKSLERFAQEAQLLLVAGTVTTATAIASAIVYLLLDEKRLIVLMEELEGAMPDITKPAREAELEALPYLVCSNRSSMIYGVSIERI
jgi:cytochrome P450